MQEVTETPRGKPPDGLMQTKDTTAGKDAQVRRTRGHDPLKASAANGQRSNGHTAPAAEHDRERTRANGQSKRAGPNGKAASDDAGGRTAAMAQNSAEAASRALTWLSHLAPRRKRARQWTQGRASPAKVKRKKYRQRPSRFRRMA